MASWNPKIGNVPPQKTMNSQEKEERKMASWNPKIGNVPPKNKMNSQEKRRRRKKKFTLVPPAPPQIEEWMLGATVNENGEHSFIHHNVGPNENDIIS